VERDRGLLDERRYCNFNARWAFIVHGTNATTQCSANERCALVFILGCGLSRFFPKVLSKLCALWRVERVREIETGREMFNGGGVEANCLL